MPDKTYPIDDDNDDNDDTEEQRDDDASRAGGESLRPGPTPESLPLEDDDEPPPEDSPHALDVCPNCGAPMRGVSKLLCMRCGFNLKTMKVEETQTGIVEEPDAPEPPPALVRPGPGDPWLSPALAGVGILVLAAGCLAGTQGLFPELDPGATAERAARLTALARLPVFVLVWTACGVGALAFGAHLFGRPLGPPLLATSRMLAAVVTARLVSFLDMSSRPFEFVVEGVFSAAAFFALCMVLFRIKPRDAATLLAIVVVLFVLIYAMAEMIVWVT